MSDEVSAVEFTGRTKQLICVLTSITPSTPAMSAMLLMSARAAGAFGAPPRLTSNEQPQRDSARCRKGLTANRSSQTHQTRCQAEPGEQNGGHPAKISLNHPGCSHPCARPPNVRLQIKDGSGKLPRKSKLPLALEKPKNPFMV